MFNSLGNIIKLTTFGESHSPKIGGILDGIPQGIKIDISQIQYQLNRRKPGQSDIVSPREEQDIVEIISGLNENITTGFPISFVINNNNIKPKDYQFLENFNRPSHSDFTYRNKYKYISMSGGSRSSARETTSWVVAGSIASMIIPQIKVYSYVSQIGNISLDKENNNIDLSTIDSNKVRCPDFNIANKMIDLINEVKTKGDTIGGTISCKVKNMPIGLGEPIFKKLSSELAKAMFTINAVKGFEIGKGFESTKMLGSEYNDIYISHTKTKTNNAGGILAGISNGMDLEFNVGFKPISSIQKIQKTANLKGEFEDLKINGRHDTCVLPRAVPIVEAMTYFVLADMFMMDKLNR